MRGMNGRAEPVAPSRLAALRAGDRLALARAISDVENDVPGARTLLASLQGSGAFGRAHVIGITGPPGAGKSTLVDALLKVLVARG